MYNLHTPYAEMTTLTPKWAGVTRKEDAMKDDAKLYLKLTLMRADV